MSRKKKSQSNPYRWSSSSPSTECKSLENQQTKMTLLSVLHPPKTLYGDQTWLCRRWCNSTSWSCYWSPWETFCSILHQMDLKYHQIPTAQSDVFCTTVMNRCMFIGQEIRTDWCAGAQAGFERIRQDNFSLGSECPSKSLGESREGTSKPCVESDPLDKHNGWRNLSPWAEISPLDKLQQVVANNVGGLGKSNQHQP